MFCHRWLLVSFKREFNENDILFIWEASWIHYETNSFHLFICIAIIAIYGHKPIDKNMNIDELMVYFNTLSNQMPSEIVLSQGRGYLNKFCKCEKVNCKLYGIMNKSFWEKDSPKLYCDECNGYGTCSKTGPFNKESVC